MFSRIIICCVRNELDKMNFKIDNEISLISVKNNIFILRVYRGKDSFIVKYFEKYNVDDEIKKWKILNDNKVNVVKMIATRNKVIIYEDYDNCKYRKVCNNDLNSEDSVVKLIRWYKKLHAVQDDGVEDYNNYFCLENIKKIMKDFRLENNKGLCYICDNFKNINLKFNRLNKCLLYGHLDLNDFVVCNETGEFFLTCFEKIKYGYKYMDIKDILSVLDKDYYDVFVREMNGFSDDEVIIDSVVSVVIDLYLASLEKVFPFWGKKALNNALNGELFCDAKSIVEWY